MLIEKEKSCLLLIDVQEKLTPLVDKSESLIQSLHRLLELANNLSIPIIVSEQYPAGLGATIASLEKHIAKQQRIEKLYFSCWREENFKSKLRELGKKQLILGGIETHVCVLQTAVDLVAAAYEVFVVVDTVAARSELDHHFGLKRMAKAGVKLVTLEMVFFEWLKRAGTTEFKLLSKQFFAKS